MDQKGRQAIMFMHVDTLAAIGQERRADLMREAMVLRMLNKESTARRLRQRFWTLLAQHIQPRRVWQAPRSQVGESLSQHSTT
jgi:hypothetical protein